MWYLRWCDRFLGTKRYWEVRKNQVFSDFPQNIKKISTHLLPWRGWFCPVASEPVEPYFTRFLRALSFCLRVSNGVVNGVVKGKINAI